MFRKKSTTIVRLYGLNDDDVLDDRVVVGDNQNVFSESVIILMLASMKGMLSNLMTTTSQRFTLTYDSLWNPIPNDDVYSRPSTPLVIRDKIVCPNDSDSDEDLQEAELHKRRRSRSRTPVAVSTPYQSPIPSQPPHEDTQSTAENAWSPPL